MSDMVGNPEDRFSRVAAPMICHNKLYDLAIHGSLNQASTQKAFIKCSNGPASMVLIKTCMHICQRNAQLH